MSVSEFATLSGLRAVVTGSTSGIGRAIALEFVKAGSDVVIHGCRNQIAAESVATELRRHGPRVIAVMADVGEEDTLPAFVERCWTELGGIDIWVNNAGADC